ncbi:MAG: DGQHR domain-containing protein [Alteromonadaceae bacterium]|nr:DGQHR domain-containing protein [Alteromonadaceae bacterium]
MPALTNCYTPTDRTFVLGAFTGNDGVANTFNCTLTYDDFSQLATLSDATILEEQKLQRDTTQSRIKGIANYLAHNTLTIFNQAMLVVSRQASFKKIGQMPTSGTCFGEITIPPAAERLYIDGQGRLGGITEALKHNPSLGTRTIDTKIIILDTDTLEEDKAKIKQIFHDINKLSTRVNTSIGIYFDSSSHASSFPVSLFEKAREEGLALAKHITVEGNSTKLYKLDQFKRFCNRLTSLGDSKINKMFDDKALLEMYSTLGIEAIRALSTLSLFEPTYTKADAAKIKNKNVLACAIGIEAVGYVAQQICINALLKQQKPDLSVLSRLDSVDFSRENPVWLDQVVDKNGLMIKGSSRKMAVILLGELGERIDPTFALNA